MTDVDVSRKGPYRGYGHRHERGTKIRIDNLPTPQELAEQPHKGDDADRFTLYTPDQIEAETKDVKICITFGNGPSDPAAVIKIRDQAEMVIAGMRAIIEKTRQHDIGSTRQRIEARAEAASLGRALSRFNGRTPHGDWKPKSRRP
ncbi:MAG: hypothetical protein ACOY4R_27345 [Pseudomonadota bacterium]